MTTIEQSKKDAIRAELAKRVAERKAALDRAMQEGGVSSLPPDAARSGVAR